VATDECQPTDKKLPRVFRTVWIRFGTPLPLDHYAGREHDRLVLRQVADELMYEIRELSGYAYVDTYATKSKDGAGGHDHPEATAVITPVEQHQLAS
jgi:1-acyl-sn-glycerol-3-phosphate acyltransferase